MSSDSMIPDRLADFILDHQDAIIAAWVEFARTIWPGASPSPEELRNNVRGMLLAIAADMRTRQSSGEQKRKSEGVGNDSPHLDGEALQHAKERLSSGFDILKVVAEFRALRASVMRIWQASHPVTHAEEVNDLVRFNEALDQLVSISVDAHSARVEQGRRLFLGVIGHDLRQPLCSVRLLAAALVRAGAGVDIGAIVAKIQDGVESMDALVRDLLDLSSSQLGTGMTVYPTACDLAELAKESIAQMEAAHPDKVFKRVSEGNLTGEWDGVRLRQLLSNLLGNAVQHGSVLSPVELEVQDAGEDIRIAVRNSGRPIPPHVLSLLFEPLMRHSLPATGDRPGSNGLGLFVCREIVKAHRGRIEVSSSQEGITVFTIELPKAGPAKE